MVKHVEISEDAIQMWAEEMKAIRRIQQLSVQEAGRRRGMLLRSLFHTRWAKRPERHWTGDARHVLGRVGWLIAATEFVTLPGSGVEQGAELYVGFSTSAP